MNMKIFFFRHQAAGVLWEYPFPLPPTDEQLKPLLNLMRARYTEAHPKTGNAWWYRIEGVDLIEVDGLPIVELPNDSTVAAGTGSGDFRPLTAKGAGSVKPPV